MRTLSAKSSRLLFWNGQLSKPVDMLFSVCKTPDGKCLWWGSNTLSPFSGANVFTATPCASLEQKLSYYANCLASLWLISPDALPWNLYQAVNKKVAKDININSRYLHFPSSMAVFFRRENSPQDFLRVQNESKSSKFQPNLVGLKLTGL